MVRRRISVRLAWIVAIVAFSVAIATGPVTHAFLHPTQAEAVHYAVTYGMLGSVLLLMVALVHERKSAVQKAVIDLSDDALTISPCPESDVLRWEQEALDSYLENGVLPRATSALGQYRVVSLEGLQIPPTISILLSKLTSMRILDVTQATLPPNFWTSLEGCAELDHVLAFQVTDASLPKEVFMSIPEIKVHSERLALIART